MKHYPLIVLIFAVLISLGLQQSATASDGKEQIKTLSKPASLSAEDPNRRTGIHDGNRIRSPFTNFGNLSTRTLDIRGEWPKGSGINYLFESDFYVGAEVIGADNTAIHIFTDSYTGGPRDKPQNESHTYSWEPLPGFFNQGPANVADFPAMSHLPDTWPALWPNRLQDWAGKWIGEFGSFAIADQESYYLMDDRNNDEFAYYPFVGSHQDSMSWPNGRRGLGLEVQVRAYQWTDPRLQDVWFAIYDIKNVSHKDLAKVVCGFYHDWDIGTEGGRGDGNDDNLNYDAQNDMIYQWDKQGLSASGKPTGYVTQKILQSPDNLGLTSFYGTFAGDAISDDEEAWQVKTLPRTYTIHNAETLPFDVAFISGSGYFSLLQGETKRYAIAITMGKDIASLLRNSRMAQWFYNGGYSFAVHQAELQSPLGGEMIQGSMDIKWSARTLDAPLLVDIFCSIDDWASWNTIATDQENDGAFQWDTNTVSDGINYSIRVIAHNDSGMGQSLSSNHLTINNPPAATPEVFITSPVSDQAISGRHDIRWRAGDADGDVVTVDLFYSPDSGLNWRIISAHEANDGIYSWDTTPLPNGDQYILKAVVNDGALEGVDILDRPFRIANDHPSIKPAEIKHVAGSSSALVGIHITDRAALTDHTFELTFSLAESTIIYHVYDMDAASFVLQNAPVTPNEEGLPFMGVRLWLHDFPEPTPVDSLTRWIAGDANLIPVVDKDPGNDFMAIPADFEIRIMGANADTSYAPVPRFQVPVNFQVWNVTDSVQMEFLFTEFDVADGKITENDQITLITNRIGRRYSTAWRIVFHKPPLEDSVLPESGDIALISIAKPFAETDVYRFQTLPENIVSVPVETRSVESFRLLQNYPNPFNAGTTIAYDLAKATKVTLQVFDLLGREVVTLVNDNQRQGVHRIYWNGRDNGHQPVASGIYVFRITAGDYVETKKMVMLK